jgi:hypothetical protein
MGEVPVAWYDGKKFYANQEAASMCCADMEVLKPLYTAPQPTKSETLTDAKVKEAIRAEIESLESGNWSGDKARFAIASLQDLCYRLGVVL